jgi:hypothetical protein
VSSTVQIGSYALDVVRGELRGAGPTVHLSELEATFLAYLARRQETVISKDELLREVWGYAEGVASRAVDATLIRARKKVEPLGLEIASYRGRGLQLIVPAGPEPAIERPLLIGRDEALAELERLTRDRGVVCVWGPPGVGKTTLVRNLSRGHVLEAQGQEALQAELATLLGCATADIAARLASDDRVFIVDEHENRSQDEIERIAEWGRTGHFVVVGTALLAYDRAQRLEPLTEAAGAALLVELAGIDAPVARELVEATDGLPRQLTLVADAIGFLGVEGFRELGGGVFPELEQVVQSIVDQLDDEDQALLGAVSVFAERFDVLAVAHVTGRTPYTILPAMERLWKRSLVQGERGVFGLLSAVRAVASRYAPADGLDRLATWTTRLHDDNLRGGWRWLRHHADLGRILQVSRAHAAEAGMLLVLHHSLGRSALPFFAAAALDAGLPRLEVTALEVLARAVRGEDASALAAVLDQPLAVPSHEALRQAALLATGPKDAPADGLLALEAEAGFGSMLMLVTAAAAAGWQAPIDLLVRYATLAEQAGLDASTALHTWAVRTAHQLGDPRATALGRRAGIEARIATELREDDPDAAIHIAESLLSTPLRLFEEVVCRGLLGVVLAALGRDEEARDTLAPVLDTTHRLGFYVHLARAMLGLPATFPNPRDQACIDAWQTGSPLPRTDLHTDQAFLFVWALSRRPCKRPAGSSPSR